MSAGAALAEGQSLTIPSGVARSGHSASTFQPYDPSEAIGDVRPIDPVTAATTAIGAALRSADLSRPQFAPPDFLQT